MKTTPIRNCQSCGKPFNNGDIVYFVPLDNNIVCHICAIEHDKVEPRVVEGAMELDTLFKVTTSSRPFVCDGCGTYVVPGEGRIISLLMVTVRLCPKCQREILQKLSKTD